jgi:hypothetical protein
MTSDNRGRNAAPTAPGATFLTLIWEPAKITA